MKNASAIPDVWPKSNQPENNGIYHAVIEVRSVLAVKKTGGLYGIERAILSLREAGVEHFQIVFTGTAEVLIEEVKSLPRLKGMDMACLKEEEKAAGFNAPFLFVLSDYLFAVPTIRSFIKKALTQPGQSAYACCPDKEGPGLFAGLYYYPQKQMLPLLLPLQTEGMRAIAVERAGWFHFSHPDKKKAAGQFLQSIIRRQEDGWVSRRINRPISTRLTFLLANLDIHPNTITTLALLLTLAAAWLAGSGQYIQIVMGAVIFQTASILDGTDGELARLTFRTSRFGSWYDQVASNIRYIIFFGALGVGAWLSSGSQIYLFAVAVMAAMAIYTLSQMIIFAWKHRHKAPLQIVPDRIPAGEQTPLFSSIYNLWRQLNRQDVLALTALLFCIVFLYQAMFWLALMGTTATAILVSRSVTAATLEKQSAAANFFGKIDPIFFYLLGVVILCALIFNMDLQVVSASLSKVGNKVFLIFSVAILWIITNALCIQAVIGRGKVPFPDLVYNQLAGDAYNTIIPMAGLGGEPFKIKHLTQWLDWHTASRSIVVDRLIHSNTGILFGALGVGAMLLFVDGIPAAYFVPLTIACVVLLLISVAMAWLTLTKAPSKLAGYALKKLKIIEQYRNDPIPPGRFFLAYFYKFLRRVFILLELYVMFLLFDIHPSLIDLTAVGGMLSLSATLFFIIPQGIGVNESGISLALGFLGYPVALGLTFGLLRRARMIFWALFGIALHLGSLFLKKIRRPAREGKLKGRQGSEPCRP